MSPAPPPINESRLWNSFCDSCAFRAAAVRRRPSWRASAKFDSSRCSRELHRVRHGSSPHPGGGEAGNLVVKLPGNLPGPRRLLMAHVDTVPICVGASPIVDGDRIRSTDPHTGLGGDDRAGTAVVLHTVIELVRQRLPHPPLTAFFCVQEEIGLYGAGSARRRNSGTRRSGSIGTAATRKKVCIGATGDYALHIELEGIASHAGVNPELGVSALAIAAMAIADLQKRGWHGLIERNGKHGTAMSV